MNNKRGSDVDDAISNFWAWAKFTGPISAALNAINGAQTPDMRSECVTLARKKADNARTVFEQPQPIAPITN